MNKNGKGKETKQPGEKGETNQQVTGLKKYTEKSTYTKKSTFSYSFIFVLLLWAISISYVVLEPEFSDIDVLHRITMMFLVLLVITIFAFFPALIYGIFDEGKDRAKNKTEAELEHHKINLVTGIKEEIEEVSNAAYNPESYKWPVLLATYSMIIGWVLFFFSEGPGNFYGFMRLGAVSHIFDNLGSAHPIVFGFLGAYFWSLGTLFHRYIRGDLKANVYIHITTRIWIVFILTLVLSAVWPGYDQFWITLEPGSDAPKWLLAASFFVGIFPNLGLELIKKATKGLFTLRSAKEISLNEIQGLSIWDQGRLAEEGIDNVQNLATSDVVGLIVNTRLSVMSLLNWVDQAILIIHANKSYKTLRDADILMATDFEAIYAGRLGEEKCRQFNKELDEDERETYLGCKGITRIPPPNKGLIAALPKKKEADKTEGEKEAEEFDIKERMHNIMIAICDDINYQRVWQIRHGSRFDETS